MCLLRALILAGAFLMFQPLLIAQTIRPVCGDEQIEQLLQELDSNRLQRLNRQHLQQKDFIQQIRHEKNPLGNRPVSGDSNFTIPVVVHVVYPPGQAYGTGTNISYAQIRSQIEALNAAFSKGYAAYNGQSHTAYATDTRIRFCLAKIPTDTVRFFEGPGGTEYGVMRYPSGNGAYNHYINASSATQLMNLTHPSAERFPFRNFLNIWLVSTIDGGNSVMGYAPRPILPYYTLDGVVIRADIFGDNSTGNNYSLGFGLSQGKVLVHEVGHYLNLYHIFQGGCSGMNAAGAATDPCDLNGDQICDIEPAATQHYFCSDPVPNTCTANYSSGTTALDMVQDYMSYADDDCMNTFTPQQAERMWSTLRLYRSELWDAGNLVAAGVLGTTGCVPPFLNSNIRSEYQTYCINQPASFSNPSAGNTAITRAWHFPGGNPATATGTNAQTTYAQPGTYRVYLTVSDSYASRTDSIDIQVISCQLDSSKRYMAHWYFGEYGCIDFSDGRPRPKTTALDFQSIHPESAYPGQLPYIGSTISQSDSSGNLLFYSNGVSVWNRNHQKITSQSLFGACDINAGTGIISVPWPEHPGKYFIIGVYPNFNQSACGIRSALVDVDADTVSLYHELNHPLLPQRFSEFLTAVPHCNGSDYWIITKGYGLENTRFYSLLITASGFSISQAPVISNDIAHPGFNGSGNQLKANKQGNSLLLASPHGALNIETGAVYDFDNQTGLISNERKIPNIPEYSNIQGGGSFSPDGRYFYLARSTNFATNGPPYWMFQYRLSDLSWKVRFAPGFYFASAYQIGPDRNIYVTTQDHNFVQISRPDDWDGFQVEANPINMSALNPQIKTGVSIPSFMEAERPVPERPDFTITALSCDSFRLEARCFDQYTATWNLGDGTAPITGHQFTHRFNPGRYAITLTMSNSVRTFGSTTKTLDALPQQVRITGPDYYCVSGVRPAQYFIDPQPTGGTFYWDCRIGGAISGSRELPFADVVWNSVPAQGTVELRVTAPACLLTANKTVTLFRGPAFIWNLPDSICQNDSSFTLRASPSGGQFRGTGVTNGTFNPAQAGPGYHTLTYQYEDEVTCKGEIQRTLKVTSCNQNIPDNADCDRLLKEIRIASNPGSDYIQLISPYQLNQCYLYNSLGQAIPLNAPVLNRIQVTQLPAGMYYLKVFCGGTSHFRVFKWLKQ